MSCVHVPDWRTVYVSNDGGETYIDVYCKLCDQSGCVGTSKTLKNDIQWGVDDTPTQHRHNETVDKG